MADTGEGKKEEADYKRLHSFPLIRVRREVDYAFTSVVDMKFYLHYDQHFRLEFFPLSCCCENMCTDGPAEGPRHHSCLLLVLDLCQGIW